MATSRPASNHVWQRVPPRPFLPSRLSVNPSRNSGTVTREPSRSPGPPKPISSSSALSSATHSRSYKPSWPPSTTSTSSCMPPRSRLQPPTASSPPLPPNPRVPITYRLPLRQLLRARSAPSSSPSTSRPRRPTPFVPASSTSVPRPRNGSSTPSPTLSSAPPRPGPVIFLKRQPASRATTSAARAPPPL